MRLAVALGIVFEVPFSLRCLVCFFLPVYHFPDTFALHPQSTVYNSRIEVNGKMVGFDSARRRKSPLVEKIMWLLALSVDASALEEVFGVREITIRTWL
jgi:hypothetical protein